MNNETIDLQSLDLTSTFPMSFDRTSTYEYGGFRSGYVKTKIIKTEYVNTNLNGDLKAVSNVKCDNKKPNEYNELNMWNGVRLT